MKTYSEIVQEYERGIKSKDDKITTDIGSLVRIYKTHQRALNDKNALEAKVAALELKLETTQLDFAVYG